jgi:hypothetical protein
MLWILGVSALTASLGTGQLQTYINLSKPFRSEQTQEAPSAVRRVMKVLG